MARGEGLPARRWFLKAMAAVALAPVLGAGGLGAAAATPSAAPSATGPAATVIAVGGVFLVNGWVLTAADLDALGLHAG